tara:strand:- start:971 stop:1216 length:246 start_codon:yes stop_codon:yes gene_type:complete
MAMMSQKKLQKIKQVEFTDFLGDKFIIHFMMWLCSNDRITPRIIDVEYQNHGEWIRLTGSEFQERFPCTYDDIVDFMDKVE